jgi:signal recognition particle receptor subunit alpha
LIRLSVVIRAISFFRKVKTSAVGFFLLRQWYAWIQVSPFLDEFLSNGRDGKVVLDYSQSDLRDEQSENGATAEIKQETWGCKTNKGEFVLKDLDEEMDAIISAHNAKKNKEATTAALGGLVRSSLGAIGGLFQNVVGGKTLTKEDLVKPIKGIEEHLLQKNIAREAVVRLIESVERDLISIKTPNFISMFLLAF